jgi:hypothetical protein
MRSRAGGGGSTTRLVCLGAPGGGNLRECLQRGVCPRTSVWGGVRQGCMRGALALLVGQRQEHHASDSAVKPAFSIFIVSPGTFLRPRLHLSGSDDQGASKMAEIDGSAVLRGGVLFGASLITAGGVAVTTADHARGERSHHGSANDRPYPRSRTCIRSTCSTAASESGRWLEVCTAAPSERGIRRMFAVAASLGRHACACCYQQRPSRRHPAKHVDAHPAGAIDEQIAAAWERTWHRHNCRSRTWESAGSSIQLSRPSLNISSIPSRTSSLW